MRIWRCGCFLRDPAIWVSRCEKHRYARRRGDLITEPELRKLLSPIDVVFCDEAPTISPSNPLSRESALYDARRAIEAAFPADRAAFVVDALDLDRVIWALAENEKLRAQFDPRLRIDEQVALGNERQQHANEVTTLRRELSLLRAKLDAATGVGIVQRRKR